MWYYTTYKNSTAYNILNSMKALCQLSSSSGTKMWKLNSIQEFSIEHCKINQACLMKLAGCISCE